MIESLQKLEEKQQTEEEEERQRRLQAVFEQRIGTSSKDLRITQPVVAPKITEENTKPELMPQLSWDNIPADFLLLSFENPVWLLSNKWWVAPEEVTSFQQAKQQFPKVDFGGVAEDKEFCVFDHRGLEQHIRPVLKRDSFALFFAQEPEYAEEGVDVEEAFLKARTLEVVPRNWDVPKAGFESQEDCLERVWKRFEVKPVRTIGGSHVSRLTKYDYPIRVTPFPRPFFLDFGYPLQFNFLSNLTQLEVRDYVLEVEDAIRRSLNDPDSPQLLDVASRHRLEHLVRQKSAELLTQESGRGELLLRHYPLLPLLKPEQAEEFHPILREDKSAWKVFSSEEHLPFHYSNSFVEGTPRPSVVHTSKTEAKRQRQLCLWEPLVYEDYCESVVGFKTKDFAAKSVNNFKKVLEEGFDEVVGMTARLAALRKYKLTSDEIKYFGFLNPEHELLDKLETKRGLHTPLFLSKLEWFVELEKPQETDELQEVFNRFTKN